MRDVVGVAENVRIAHERNREIGPLPEQVLEVTLRFIGSSELSESGDQDRIPLPLKVGLAEGLDRPFNGAVIVSHQELGVGDAD